MIGQIEAIENLSNSALCQLFGQMIGPADDLLNDYLEGVRNDPDNVERILRPALAISELCETICLLVLESKERKLKSSVFEWEGLGLLVTISRWVASIHAETDRNFLAGCGIVTTNL